jgi:aryl-alcohol dehydrogenase-like predicted oxidoreductase
MRENRRTMRYRTLGSTGLAVSVVGLGTWQYGGEWGVDFTEKSVAAIIDRAGLLGVNLIDTAECYGDHRSERLIGAALRGRRDRWIIATKFGHEFHGFMDRSRSFSPEAVVRQLEASLAALVTDYIDIYQCHSPTDEEFFQDRLWEILRREVEKGKIRHLGVSISSNPNTRQADAAGGYGITTAQVVYNRLDRKAEEGLLQSCQRQTIGVLARVPLASGYLSGAYSPGARFPASDVRSTHDQKTVQDKLREVQEIARNEVPAGTPLAQWAIAWCLKHPAVAAVIPGCKTPEQAAMNAGAVSLLADRHPLDVP